MELKFNKIALGGGCHWCTEAVFQSLKGVEKVEQGFVSSVGENTSFSEAVIVHFDPELISLNSLIEIHLHTHKSTSKHSMREKYRSAIYWFDKKQEKEANGILSDLQFSFNDKLVTQVYPFKVFKASREQIANYYYNDSEKPFCKSFINPKLKLLMTQFSKHIKNEKIPSTLR